MINELEINPLEELTQLLDLKQKKGVQYSYEQNDLMKIKVVSDLHLETCEYGHGVPDLGEGEVLILGKEKDLVRGEVHINFCTSQRFTDYGCGPDAKYFEQYEPPVPEPPWWTQNLEKLKNLLG